MKTTEIKQLGFGTGAGELVEVLTRKEIESMISETSANACYELALAEHQYGYNTYCAISLITGNIFTYSMGNGETNHAIDNNHVDLICIDSNTDPDSIEDYEDGQWYGEAAYLDYSSELDERYRT